MNDRAELFTIGQLADRTGLAVRTIRFWSDAGVVPPTCRSSGGYRLYDAGAVPRLDLVRTLRELGLELDAVRQILSRQASVADVASAHACALDAEIRILQVRRRVLRAIARRGVPTEEMTLMHRLATLSAPQRQQIIDDFVAHVFAGVDEAAPGARIAQAMRQLPAELPADPAPEQVDAWIELAELASDPEFRERSREMAVAGAAAGSGQPRMTDPAPVLEHAGGAVAAGVAPESAAGKVILDRIVPAETPAGERATLADQIETFTDRRVERYWQLIGVINGRPAVPSTIPAFEWLVTALRVHAGA